MTIAVDIEATRAIYERVIADECDCSPCQNIRAQFARLVEPIKDMLAAAGIDPYKHGETLDYGPSSLGNRFGEAEFAFVGQTQSGQGQDPDIAGYENWHTPAFCAPDITIKVYRGGIPWVEFDETGRRWTLATQFHAVRWVLDEPQAA